MSTITFDPKNIPAEVLALPDIAERFRVTEDGHRWYDLDLVMTLETRDYNDNKPGSDHPRVSWVGSRTSTRFATNKREYEGTTLYDFSLPVGWDDENWNVAVSGQPAIQGPYLSAYLLGSTVTLHKQPTEKAILIEAGDIVKFLGTEYVVGFDRQYPTFTQKVS